MKRMWPFIRFGSLGVMATAVIGALQGCDYREATIGLLALIALLLAGGGGSGNTTPESIQVTMIQDEVNIDGDVVSRLVTFDAVVESPENVNTYSWTFGDGGTDSGKTVTHRYVGTGSFEVTATVVRDDGETTLTATLIIKDQVVLSSIGQIQQTVLDRLQLTNDRVVLPDIIEVGPGVVAIPYEGPDSDGFVATFSIDGNGNIGGSPIDVHEFNTSNATRSSIIQVGPGVYAIAYRGQNGDGFVTTVSIDSSGNIGGNVDQRRFDNSSAEFPDIISVGSGMYAIGYEGPDDDGFLVTLGISSTGIIDAITDSFEFDTNRGQWVKLIEVGTGVFAVVYQGTGDDGIIKTLNISGAGAIDTNVIDTLTYADQGAQASVVNVSADVYAIAYQSTGNDGTVSTVSIGSTGNIGGGAIDNLIFETGLAQALSLVDVGGGVFVVAYNNGGNGFITSFGIDNAGNVTNSVLDKFLFEAGGAFTMQMIQLASDVLAIAHSNPFPNGFLSTVKMK